MSTIANRLLPPLRIFNPELASQSASSILLVEDDDAVRLLAATTLRLAGYQVVEAIDGLDGLTQLAFSSKPIDLVLTDVKMPSLDGVAMVDRMRNGRRGLKVLFMSGWGEIAPGAGADCLNKPFTPSELVNRVHSALSRD